MEFKLGDIVTYKEKYHGDYKVYSEDEKDFWLQSIDFPNVFLRYPPELFKLV